MRCQRRQPARSRRGFGAAGSGSIAGNMEPFYIGAAPDVSDGSERFLRLTPQMPGPGGAAQMRCGNDPLMGQEKRRGQPVDAALGGEEKADITGFRYARRKSRRSGKACNASGAYPSQQTEPLQEGRSSKWGTRQMARCFQHSGPSLCFYQCLWGRARVDHPGGGEIEKRAGSGKNSITRQQPRCFHQDLGRPGGHHAGQRPAGKGDRPFLRAASKQNMARGRDMAHALAGPEHARPCRDPPDCRTEFGRDITVVEPLDERFSGDTILARP